MRTLLLLSLLALCLSHCGTKDKTVASADAKESVALNTQEVKSLDDLSSSVRAKIGTFLNDTGHRHFTKFGKPYHREDFYELVSDPLTKMVFTDYNVQTGNPRMESTYHYDDQARLILISSGLGGGGDSLHFAYDKQGNLVEHRKTGFTVRWKYGDDDLLDSEDYQGTHIEFKRTGNVEVKEMYNSQGKLFVRETFTFDGKGLLSKRKMEGIDSKIEENIEFKYNDEGQLTAYHSFYQNKGTGSERDLRQGFNYDQYGFLSQQIDSVPKGEPIIKQMTYSIEKTTVPFVLVKQIAMQGQIIGVEKYTIDQRGNWLEKNIYARQDMLSQKITREIKYQE